MKPFLISASTVRVPYDIYRSGLDYITVAKLLKVEFMERFTIFVTDDIITALSLFFASRRFYRSGET